MWDFKQLKWMAFMGWWPTEYKNEKLNKFHRFRGYLLYFVVFLEFGPELFSIFSAFRDGIMDLAILNSNQMLLGVEWCMKTTLFIVNEKKIKSVIRKLKEMDSSARAVLSRDQAEKCSSKRMRICDLLVVFLLVKTFALVVWITRPIIMLVAFGVKQNLIDAWTPIETKTTIGWSVIFIIQAIHVVSAIEGFIISDNVMLCILQMYLLQTNYLKCLLKNISFKYSNKRSSQKLRYCIKFHQRILLLGREINALMKYSILYQTIIATIVICLSVFEFSTIRYINIVRRILTLTVAVFQAYIVLIYCLFCQEIEEENEQIIRAAYDNNWYEASLKDKKAILFLIKANQKARPFGLIVHSDLNLFISVMKTTFSYYQFLDTMIE